VVIGLWIFLEILVSINVYFPQDVTTVRYIRSSRVHVVSVWLALANSQQSWVQSRLLRHSGIWGAVDEEVLYKVHTHFFLTCIIIQVIKLEVDGNIIDLPHIEGIIILNIMRFVSKSKETKTYRKIFWLKGQFYSSDIFKKSAKYISTF